MVNVYLNEYKINVSNFYYIVENETDLKPHGTLESRLQSFSEIFIELKIAANKAIKC